MTCDTTKLREIFDRGLSRGIGEQFGRMCIEAAIAVASGEPFRARPTCVHIVDRSFSIEINDAHWDSPQTRAEALWPLALAQLGTVNKDRSEWVEFLASGVKTRIGEPTMEKLAQKYKEFGPIYRESSPLTIKGFLRNLVRNKGDRDIEFCLDTYNEMLWLARTGSIVEHAVSSVCVILHASKCSFNSREEILKLGVEIALEAYAKENKNGT